MEIIEFVDDNEILMDYFDSILASVDHFYFEDALIKCHQQLIGKTCKCSCWEVKDCGVDFIKKILNRDFGRSIVYEYTMGAQKFIKSKYLSNYFKDSINDLTSDKDLEIKEILNSDKHISQMTESELIAIYSFLKDCYTDLDSGEIVNIASCFIPYLYKLDGEGISSFIKNNVSYYNLADHILGTSGLNPRASYYSGRGVKLGDLNHKNLVAIFNKLLKFDIGYAVNFVQMVLEMETLGATEFITSFKNLAASGFDNQNFGPTDKNISLSDVYDDARVIVGLWTYASSLNNGRMISQIAMSDDIKKSFIQNIEPVLQEVAPLFLKETKEKLQNVDYRNYVKIK